MPYSDPEKAKAAKKRYAEKNREKINAAARARNEDPAVKAAKNAYYESRKGEILANAKVNYELKKPEKLKAAAEYREKNRGKISLYFKRRNADMKAHPELYRSHIEKKQLSFAEWQKKNREKLSAQTKARRYSDIEGYRKYARDYQRKRYASDVHYALRMRLTCRVSDALKNNRKSGSTLTLIGCTIPQLRSHIESLFTEGMTWDLFLEGSIHLDHKKPCALFDLSLEEHQRRCFHYTNLQPLWALDNLRKSDK